MRTAQFAEDAGPMAHPVQPDSFIEISNFYTMTIYEKGAEVVRMKKILGKEGFRKGSDCYFDRHDGQAVTINDFVRRDGRRQCDWIYRILCSGISKQVRPKVSVKSQYLETKRS